MAQTLLLSIFAATSHQIPLLLQYAQLTERV